jgi:hypothetical protein
VEKKQKRKKKALNRIKNTTLSKRQRLVEHLEQLRRRELPRGPVLDQGSADLRDAFEFDACGSKHAAPRHEVDEPGKVALVK